VQFFENGFFTAKNRLLRQVSDSQGLSLLNLAGIRRLYSENHFQQRGFSAPVAPDKPNLLGGVYLQIEPVKNHLRPE
jgi:hypothetical protein